MNFLKSVVTWIILFFSSFSMHPKTAPRIQTLIMPLASASATLTQTPTLTTKRKSIQTSTIQTNDVKGETITRATGDSGMATADELFSAMNDYRKSHGLNAVNRSSTLCTIAQTRANQQEALGHLDNHAGFVSAARTQTEFIHVGELLQYWSIPEDATYLVNTGWGQSEEHVAIMTDPTLTDGCGAINGYYSVFIFGRK